ncbi:MAG: aminotransferase class I/II-fold pyridoxal phosphate-dependent enzyme [Bacteroidales bacterium]|nr:aminotransferase class I/II-fold pyridoxal phosphate-dependent enzyme [Bacteroidales bacterium]MBN2817328.1 aminotransferase class I/II-fold pyridoxal phosphate-dependent enzyme [Bacteroidales bacterium]
MKKYKHFETNAIRGQMSRSQKKEHSVPIFATSSFVFNSGEEARAVFAEETDGYMYSRYNNPNTDEFVEKLCALEGVEEGLAVATGMAANYLALMPHLVPGDHIVASRSLFTSSHQIITQILPRFGITHTYVDCDDNEGFANAVQPNTKLFFIETPSNPGLDLVDLALIVKIARKNNCLVAVDNSFASPYIQNPGLLGADMICHSATKFIDGQGRTMGGAILGSAEAMEAVRFYSRQSGPTLAPFNAWVLSKSLETLPLRMEKHCENAMKLAEFLESAQGIKSVRYPFLPSHPQYELAKRQMRLGGGIVSFEIEGGYERCIRFIDKLEMVSITPNLGDSRTAITHPASTTHSKLSEEERQMVNITKELVRTSVGLEHIDDIIGDVQQALDRSK